MFTGIVQETGTVLALRDLGDNSIQIDIDCKSVNKKTSLGDSICISGICLTVEAIDVDSLTFTAISETVNKTNISMLHVGQLVNIEESATANTLIGGHPITGHIDVTSKVLNIIENDIWKTIRFKLSPEFINLVIPKGSICIDGVSLTISDVSNHNEPFWFEVSLIPATLEKTTLKSLKIDDVVNIEFDQVGKYIAQNIRLQNVK